MDHMIQCLEWLPDVARESWEQRVVDTTSTGHEPTLTTAAHINDVFVVYRDEQARLPCTYCGATERHPP